MPSPAKELSKTKHGEMSKVRALLPLLGPLVSSGSLRSVLEASGTTARRGCWLEACTALQENQRGGEPVCSPRQTSAGWQREKTNITLSEVHSSGALAVHAPVNLNKEGVEISVVQDQNGCTQSRQRFLHQLGGCCRHVPECSTSRRKSERRRNEANCFESE